MAIEAFKHDRERLAHAYLPVVRGFLLCLSVYFSIMTVAHLIVRSGHELAILGSTTAVSAALVLYAHADLARLRSSGRIELTMLGINLLVVANTIIVFVVRVDPNKFVYFLLIAMIFAMTGFSLRVAVTSVLAALVAMFAVILLTVPRVFSVYAFMSIAGLVCSIGALFTMRSAFIRTIAAQSRAEAREREAVAQANTDSLTGIPNRRNFFSALDRSDMIAADRIPCLIAIDLDGFKPINDHYGHKAGDTLLVVIAARIAAAVPEGAMVARVGGDEFMVLLGVDEAEAAPRQLGRRLLEAIEAPVSLGEDLVHVSASIGCALAEAAGTGNRGLAEKADFALYYAKRNRKGEAVIFSEVHASEQADFFAIGQALRAGDLEREIDVVFQPQFRLATGRAIGAEALVRWKSCTLHEVSPSRFIPAAEASGMIGQITLIVVRKALAALARLPSDFYVSINLSARDITSETVMAEIFALVSSSNVRPERIEFEVTETAMVADFERALASLDQLVRRGHRIALDDFGTGYSNFGHLSRLPISKLKIDRSFVADWTASHQGSKLIKTMIDMSIVLGIDSVLEGIETQVELDLARASGATIGQGYLLGWPMSADALIKGLGSGRRMKIAA